MSTVLGIHHVTAIASDPQRNLDFYAGALGLRLVKRTVNFDDPGTFHFYFGDETGSPGSLLTFFPWPDARRGRIGTGQVAVTSFAAPAQAMGFWVGRMVQHGIAFEGPVQRAAPGGRENVLTFRDPDGLSLEIVASAAAEVRPGWGGAPGIASEQALRGIHAVTLWVASREASERLLVDTLGFRDAGGEEATRWFLPPDGGTGRVDLREVGDFPRGMDGAGTVHHVAWRAADDATQLTLRQAVSAAGRRPTPVIDRTYFQSVYFREPGGVLFELATDGPGFLIDERVDRLGQSLKLPPQYEAARVAIEAHLPPIHLPGAAGQPASAETDTAASLGFTHRFIPASDAASRTTLLLLHGTGGNEDDLLPLGRILLPGAALLSPRGQVLEHGKPRFFRRLAEGVFDQEDLARRTADLAEFVRSAARVYQLDPAGVVAVGFSNGANIAGSLLLRSPGLIRSAVLLSPMVPFEPEAPPELSGTAVFMGAGRADTMVTPEQTERLRQLLEACGAAVTLHWDEGGHNISPSLVAAARGWLAERLIGQKVP